MELLIVFLKLLAAVGFAVSAWYCAAVLYGARRFVRERKVVPHSPADPVPGVTILKPLKGLEPGLFENLASFCRQDYPKFQVIFAVADPADPAIPVVRRLIRAFPDVAIDLVVDPTIYGTNYKISNLQNGYRLCRYDYLVIADSDIRVPPHYLRTIVADLLRPEVGVVTCLYRARPVGGWPAKIEALFVNTDFTPSVFVARMVETTRYAFGATMAIRRDVLQRIGGFLALSHYLADDFFLGNLVSRHGFQVEISPLIVDTYLAVPSWKRLVEHQLRWSRTYRSVRGGSYFALVLTHGCLWALANLVLYWGNPWAWAAALGLLAFRLTVAGIVAQRFLDVPLTLTDVAILPFKDLFLSLMWASAFFGNTVSWSGHRFRVVANGEMVPVDGLPVVPATVDAAASSKLSTGTDS
ncbi:MAG: bacteriohopanetetrol glucosamine biosynthesis glycosyltransferase HpnI [Candidatus Binatia bacterium]|nr:bacteriohopanetetrol glucosamine biosynthesis glycosyltransferase HpnI [Candidatus Binatia bacterium]